MKAMILAAGLGTRLRPLTNDCPKALVEIAGRTLLDIVLSRLRAFGIHDVIINIHHFPDMITDYLRHHGNFGMHIEISHESELLDTGGGLKKAAWFFLNNSSEMNVPFVLHNVDVITNVDLRSMLVFHTEHEALATIAVQHRKTSRHLLFDDELRLCGRRAGPNQTAEIVRGSNVSQQLAFTGIHIISPHLLGLLQDGVFSIIDSYLKLAARGERIIGFQADDYYWCDLGRPESIAKATKDLIDNPIF